MFARLGAYLEQQKITRSVRYHAPSGEVFVLMPAKEYTMITGIDAENLPTLSLFDTVPEKVKDTEDIENVRHADTLAHIPLEEEISVNALPL